MAGGRRGSLPDPVFSGAAGGLAHGDRHRGAGRVRQGRDGVHPGQRGWPGSGTVLVFVAFGLTEAAGVTFALVRRVREIIWIAFGLWALAMQSRVAAPAEPCDPPPV